MVTRTQVHVLLQQKEVFREIIQQKNCFKCLVEMIMDSTNNRPDDMLKELQDLKTSIQSTQKEMDDLKSASVDQLAVCDRKQPNIQEK